MALKQFVFADESGIQQGSPYCIVAGYRGSPGQWDRFNKEWRAVLFRFGVPDFHAKVFFHRKSIKSSRNPYCGWNDIKAKEFLNALLAVIRGRRIYPVGSAVDVNAFKALTYGERCYLTSGELSKDARRIKGGSPNSPYHLAFGLMIEDAVEGTHPDTELHFLFDKQTEYEHYATTIFFDIKRIRADSMGKQLKSVGFRERQDWPGLQAADLYAHEWYNFMARGRWRLNKEHVATMNALIHGRGRNFMPKADMEALERLLNDALTSAEVRRRVQSIAESPR